MATLERGKKYTCTASFTNNTKCKVGFDYTIINSEADAKQNNYDKIRIEPFTQRTGSANNYYSWNWQKVSLEVIYNNKTIAKKYFHRRYNVANSGSVNTKYYFIQTTNPNWTSSDPTQNTIAKNGLKKGSDTLVNELTKLSTHGDNYGLVVTIPHNDDGTPKGSVTIVIGNNRDAGYGESNSSATPKVTFTLARIARGTRIWVKTDNGWERVGKIDVKDHAASEQHYVYKKVREATTGDNGWDRIYG